MLLINLWLKKVIRQRRAKKALAALLLVERARKQEEEEERKVEEMKEKAKVRCIQSNGSLNSLATAVCAGLQARNQMHIAKERRTKQCPVLWPRRTILYDTPYCHKLDSTRCLVLGPTLSTDRGYRFLLCYAAAVLCPVLVLRMVLRRSYALHSTNTSYGAIRSWEETTMMESLRRRWP
eukprot:2637832-Rhodomonas_salina.1